MIESKVSFKVQYSDTDAYKVAWHGSYLRWMEAGRVDLLDLMGISIKELDEKFNTVMPVVEIEIKYKRSAKLLEDIIVKSRIFEIKNPYIVFEQSVEGLNGEIFATAKVKGVTVHDGKLIRNIESLLKGE